MEHLSDAEVLAKVREHFEKPRAELSFVRTDDVDNPSGITCKYRRSGQASDSVRCAFGVLIPDKSYRTEMEGRSAYGILSVWPEVIGRVNRILVNELQAAHDTTAEDGDSVAVFLNKLSEIEAKYGVVRS